MKQHIQNILKISIFIICAGIIFYLLPREGQFKYEYQMGKPWNYELIVAPFNFPLQKTDSELTAERDTLLLSYHPYYNLDPNAYLGFCSQLSTNYNDVWGKFSKENHIYENHSAKYLDGIKTICKDVYNSGIISLLSIDDMKKSNLQEIVIVRSDYTFKSKVSSIYSPLTAYEKIISLAKENKDLKHLDELIQRLNINNYLFSNLTYNQEVSLRMKEELLSTISVSSGMVQTGERIVDKGQVISMSTFKKLESYKEAYKQHLGTSDQRKYLMFGQITLILVFMLMLYYFFISYRKKILVNTKDIIFILINILIMVALTAAIKHFFPFMELYIVPFSILSVVLCTFFDSRVAIFTNIVTVFICSFFAGNAFNFALLHIFSSIVTTYTIQNLNRRGQLVQAALWVFITYSVMYFSLCLIQQGNLQHIDYAKLGYFFANAVLILFAYPLIFIFEKTFNYLSNVTLIELSDTNHELIQELSEKAPGTFQHSLMVSSLSQEVARALDANILLTRVGAYFHDIGKMDDAACFTENQSGNYNPHTQLKPEESAKRIIAHIENGVKLAKKHSLPQPIIDFITMHHGCGQVKYFLNEYAKQHPGEELDKKLFTYPGPSPMTKETAILMMADSIEAASRSLPEYTEEKITELVNRIINTQLEEGNFRYAPISFYEIDKAKEIFIKRLKIIYHTRVAYPTKEEITENLEKTKTE